MTLPRLFRSLRNFNFLLWAAGSFVSNVGTWVQGTAQDWLVYSELTAHDASAVGLVVALQFGPQLLLLPWTGVAADRFDRRRLLIATQSAMAALALALGALTVTGAVRLWEVDMFAVLFGAAAAFDAPTRQTFVAELVGDEDLPNAIALNSSSFTAAGLIGPAVSGLVIAAAGAGWAFVLNGLSFAAVLASLAFLRRDRLHPAARIGVGRGRFVEGLAYVRRRPDLVAILAMLFLIGTFGLNFPIFVSIMGIGVFHADAASYGLLSSLMTVGTFSGALIAAAHRPKASWLPPAATLFGAGYTLAALAPNYGSFAVALVAVGLAAMTFINATNSLMQLSTPAEMRGRLMALRVGVALGGAPIGAPVIGWVANHCGPRWALGLGAASGYAAAAVALLALRRRFTP